MQQFGGEKRVLPVNWRTGMGRAGMTLIELLIVLLILSTLSAIGWKSLRRQRDAVALQEAANAVTRILNLGRAVAISRRETIRLQARTGEILLLSSDGATVARLRIGPGTELPVDSVRARPATIRFNSRGHAGAGSIYLWRRGTTVRLVCNFLGRVRREVLSGP
jgi:prepilin-type N-terminal cleavage/methylation domain-containing protein